MKFLTVPALLAAALFSAIAMIPSLPVTRTAARPFTLETGLASSVDGVAKVYFDIGRGFNEADSVEQPLRKSDAPRGYRFALPAGRFASIRLDPLDRAGDVILSGPLRLLSPTGRVVHQIGLGELRPANQIDSAVESNGRLTVRTAATADDPQLVATFPSAASLRLSAIDLLTLGWLRALVLFLGWGGLLLALDRLPALRHGIADTARRALARPARAVMLVAAMAVIASAYPVVFLGGSYVSPNFGTNLLYDGHPTLPGSKATATATVNGSDVGAALWQHVPYSFIQRRALGQAELPLWNRYTLGGTPLLGQAQSMFGDPLHLVVIAFDGAAWAWDLKFLVAKWLFAAGVGLLAFALVGHRPAALLVALAAPFVGFYLYRINHAAIFALGYAPWVLYCWIQLARASAGRHTAGWLGALLLANIALMNSGTVKEAWLLVLQMNFAGVVALLAGSGGWPLKLGRLAGAAWVGGLLALITAPVWQTFLDTLAAAYAAAANPAANQIQPSLLLGAFDELFFRHLSAGEIVFNPSGNFVVLLGLLYFAATLRLHFADRTIMALAGCTALFMAVVFGMIPPTWIMSVPLLGRVWHIDNCFLSGLLVLWPILAAVGFRTATERLITRKGRSDLLMAGLVLLVIVSAWLGYGHAAHRQAYGPGTTLSLLDYGKTIPVAPFIWTNLALLLLASVALALIARQALRRGSLGAGGAISIALCLTVMLWRHGSHHRALGFETYLLQPPPRANFHAPSRAIEQVRTRHAAAPGRVFGMHANLVPGWNAAYGLEAIHGPDAMQTLPVRELIDASPVKWNSGWSVYVPAADIGAVRPFLDALNVRYYVDLPGNPPLADPALTLTTSADLVVYESRTAWPRAFFTDAIRTYTTPADLVSQFVASNGQPFAAVHRDAASDPAFARLPRGESQTTSTAAEAYRLTENTTSFRVRADRPGIIVLAESWWPRAFRATVNGRRAAIVRVNHAFKGVVVVAPGDYAVTFSYWPDNFTRSGLMFVAGVLLALGSFALAWRFAPGAGLRPERGEPRGSPVRE